MNVTIIVPGRWHAFDLARELHTLGALHRIVTSYPRARTRRWGIPDEKVVSLPLQLVLTKIAWKLGGERLAMRLQFRINDLFARHAARYLQGADLVHAWSGSAEPALIRARRESVPTVLERSSAHMLDQCELLRDEHSRLRRRWVETPRRAVERELREYGLADLIAVPSVFVERTFMQRGFHATRLFRNLLGVDVSRFSPAGAAPSRFVVMYAGSLTVRKGIHFLVAAFQRANLTEAKLLLVGGHSPETAQLLGKCGPEVVLTGHVPQEELVQHYRAAAVFVLPSVEDGFGMVIAQALACAVPVVCSENSGGEDLLLLSGVAPVVHVNGVREYPAGYVVPARDEEAIARVLRDLYASPELLVRKRAAAVRLRGNDLSWGRYARANLARYEQLIRRSGVSADLIR